MCHEPDNLNQGQGSSPEAASLTVDARGGGARSRGPRSVSGKWHVPMWHTDYSIWLASAGSGPAPHAARKTQDAGLQVAAAAALAISLGGAPRVCRLSVPRRHNGRSMLEDQVCATVACAVCWARCGLRSGEVAEDLPAKPLGVHRPDGDRSTDHAARNTGLVGTSVGSWITVNKSQN